MLVLLLDGLVVAVLGLVMWKIRGGPWVVPWRLRGLFIVAAGGLFAVAFEYYGRLLGW